jgi:predicted phage terminase large subunit-like protein
LSRHRPPNNFGEPIEPVEYDDYIDDPREDPDKIIRPHAGPQTCLLASKANEIFFGGALSGGKTHGLALDFAAQAERYPGNYFGLYIRNSFPETNNFVQKTQGLYPGLGYTWYEGKREWRHPNGNKLTIGYLDGMKDVDRYWGDEYTWIGVDEMTNFREHEPIAKLKVRLRSPVGVPTRFVATGNPCGPLHKYIKERYIEPALPMHPHRDPVTGRTLLFIPSKMADNPSIAENDPTYSASVDGIGGWLARALKEGDWTISPEGNIFRREYFNTTYRMDSLPNFLYSIYSWDCAFKETKRSDRSAGTHWGVTKNGVYLLNAFADKLEYPDLKRKVIDMYDSFPASALWVEDKASGISLIQELRRDTSIPLKPIGVDTNKFSRAVSVTSWFESGRVFLPERAPWRDDYIEELCAFPEGAYDDYVDSTSQALSNIQKLLRRLSRFDPENRKVVKMIPSLFDR